MPEIKVSIVVNRPLETVYQAYVDPDKMLLWTKDLERFEIIKGKFGEIGSTARLHFNENGRKSVLEDRLEYIEPKKKIRSKVSGDTLIAFVETTFISKNKQTEIVLDWSGKGKNIFVTLVLILLRGKIKNRALQDLIKFKELVESVKL